MNLRLAALLDDLRETYGLHSSVSQLPLQPVSFSNEIRSEIASSWDWASLPQLYLVMSVSRTTQLTCPECSHEQEMEIWTSVNASLQPELKEKVMQLLLNVFICEKCGHRAHVDTSFLYHDMQARYCIQYVAREDMQSPAFYENLSKHGTYVFDLPTNESVVVSGNDYFSRPHFVFSIKELPLYIAFRELCTMLGRDS